MKQLKLAAAVLASVCATSAVGAQRNQTVYILHDTNGSHLRAGDVLVADGAGSAALYRGNAFVHMVQDPEDLLSSHSSASQPLFITNAEGEVVRGNLANYAGDLFLSGNAPEHVFRSKEFNDSKVHDAGHGGGGSPLMTFHGGNVLVTPTTYSIFWGSYGSDIQSGMATFFSGFSGSSIANASKEYTGTNGQVSGKTANGTVYQDNSAPPSRALSTASAVAEVCKVTNNLPDPNAVYFIFTSTGAGHVSYCAWHSWGSCGSTPIQVAYMPNLSGVSGCDIGSANYEGHSAALAALANVTSHELSEAITDPQGTGWFDSSGGENGDKCAWAFLSEPAPEPVSLGSSKWVLQGEWSNAAYTAGTGYLNRSGQPGCLY